MAHSRTQISSGWTFRQQDGPSEEWLPVSQVPSQIHMDLLANNKIPDPYVDLNERAVQWVGEKTWVYRAPFSVPELAAEDATGGGGGGGSVTTDLVFEGLDTFATVSVNGVEVLKTDNMFVSYRVDVSAHVKTGGGNAPNVLEIVFDSALLRGRKLVERHGHEHDFLVRQTEAGRVPVRKAQYNWGWDWGPILMTAGPWKPVWIERYVARVDDVWAENEVAEDLSSCAGTIHVTLGGAVERGDRVVVSLSHQEEEDDDKAAAVVVLEETVDAVTDDKGRVSVPFLLSNPRLWYPLNYGAQARYRLRATLVRGGRVLGAQSKLIGFRRTQLVQEADAHGKSFYFRINNVDVFAGGSCWIPADSYLAAVTPRRYRDWVRLAAEGNQVMLRVWGGGVYEHDALVDACDELGVLLWHDFQFACASYPAYPSFLASVEREARQHVRRLRSHPSMVVWAGNNEDYQVQERYRLDYDFDDKDPESWLKSSFPARYLYEHLLPKVVAEEDPHMLYHPSSPWGHGKPTADPTVGDIHQWNLWHGTISKYQEASLLGGRFVSEFGMEAYPHLETVARMASSPASQLRPGSMVLDFHNKGIGHERRMMTYVVENFAPGDVSDLARYVHLTQVAQAETMRAAYKAWRRDWGTPFSPSSSNTNTNTNNNNNNDNNDNNDNGKGKEEDSNTGRKIQGRKCGGVLVWQLNDCWPTMSWAVVDYHLVPKPAWHAIRRALQPLDVGVSRTYHDWTQTGYYIDENSRLCTGQVDQTLPARPGASAFDVWVVSARVRPVAVRVAVRLVSVRTGRDVAAPRETDLEVAANATTDVLVAVPLPAAAPGAEDPNRRFDVDAYDPCVVYASLSVDGQVVATDAAWPDPIKFLDMADRGVAFQVAPAGDEVIVTAQRPVKSFVFEEAENLRVSDNGFDIMPGDKHVIKVQGVIKADKLRWTYIGAPAASMEIS
ncbi:Beta-mannosidase [Purpureocillium takamizusanense]|uniref:Beta-mannosidase B n=1 Tax=Purpureocillium takamizusanense TaxID=2060973 RepID=A0A9Q8Q5I0_9HYPO|nr:Beta-mannosidase [Purpureocillium takamizusanense]UNI14109.1 Beta-mannosidase [Purpureocillium takamizusanense]